ncbi:MAG TPA: DALR domain-containing protein, partial [Burkholderiales bacterium]|nr:DALR domain-containing protein [Burkholderiales bacterium]
EVLKQYDPEVLRYFILASHYRSPLDYSDENLKAAKSALDGLYIALRGIAPGKAAEGEPTRRFDAALADDFNTPAALAVLFDLARAVNKAQGDVAAAAELRALGGKLGLLGRDPEQYLKGGTTGDLGETEIEALMMRRNEARKNRDWAESDRIRDELKAQGVLLEDAPGGNTVWRRQ